MSTFGYLTELITSKNQMSILHTTFTQEVLHTFYCFYGKNYLHLHTKPYFISIRNKTHPNFWTKVEHFGHSV